MYVKILVVIVLIKNVVGVCPRIPEVGHSRGPKLPGDNGYRLFVSVDQNDFYVPGKTYTVSLKNPSNDWKFRRFLLTVESANETDPNPSKHGFYQLFDEHLTKYHEECVNTITEQNDNPKGEIEVMWTAPTSGCVSIRAMVLQDRNTWYADDGRLTRTLCEKSMVDKDCCACDDAKYQLTFQGIWSKTTHPKDYPTLEWLLHFSDLIGATHEQSFSFWGDKHIATDGFRTLAEWGSPGALDQELRLQRKHLRSIVRANGLWHPNVNGNTSASFKVDRRNHRLSVVSMFGPSPDWVVGVNGLELCRKDCSWHDSLTVDLYPWDAGTDSGVTYMSPNAETKPRETMYRITTRYPEDPRAPFYDTSTTEMEPLARLYLQREKIIARKCDDEFLAAQLDVTEDIEEIGKETRECRVSEWSQWSPCSVTCGKGLRMRTRDYLMPQKAQMFNCKRQLVAKEMCVANVGECPNHTDDQDDDDEQDLAYSAVPNMEMICKTTPWGPWSECTSTCGKGIMMRTRFFIDPMGMKKCPHVQQVEKKPCMVSDCRTETQDNQIESQCKLSEWSEWSPCIAKKCDEKGVRIRNRYVLGTSEQQAHCQGVHLEQKVECHADPCPRLDQLNAKDVCMQPKNPGPCRGNDARWYFDTEKLTCTPFNYGGCRGNQNNFETEQQCNDLCQTLKNTIERESDDSWKLGPWSLWSKCSVTCGEGVQERTRAVLHEPTRASGKPKLVKRRKCFMPAC